MLIGLMLRDLMLKGQAGALARFYSERLRHCVRVDGDDAGVDGGDGRSASDRSTDSEVARGERSSWRGAVTRKAKTSPS